MNNNALAVIAKNSAVSVEEIAGVLRGMIIGAKNQHGAVATDAEMAVVSSVCAKYDLNPLVKEVAAFVSGGKLQMIVMIDGWYRIVNRQENFDGVDFEDSFDEKGNLISTTCKMYLKSRSRPICVTEYMAECRDDKSAVWRKWPARMLRHKAYIQAARMAFGISEIVDDDEAQRMTSKPKPVAERDITSPPVVLVDFESIDIRMSACGTHDELKSVSREIKCELEASGNWHSVKAEIVLLNRKHFERIENENNVDFDEVAGEVIENIADSGDEVVDFGDSE